YSYDRALVAIAPARRGSGAPGGRRLTHLPAAPSCTPTRRCQYYSFKEIEFFFLRNGKLLKRGLADLLAMPGHRILPELVVAGVSPAISPVVQPTRLPLQLFELFVHFGEGVDRKFQVFAGMRSGHLRANTRSAVRHDRIEKPDHINAFLQHSRSELLRLGCIADHNGDDRMHTGLDRQAALSQSRAKVFCVLFEFVAELRRCTKKLERFQ